MSDMPVLALDFKMKKQLCNFQYYGLGLMKITATDAKGKTGIVEIYSKRKSFRLSQSAGMVAIVPV